MKLQNTNKNTFSIGLFLAIFLFALSTAHAATNAYQTNNQVVSNLQIPFNQSILVNDGDASEFVVFSGNIHLVVKYFFPNNSLLLPNPVRIHTNMMNVTGIGQTSGVSYRLDGAANFEFPVNVPGNFSFGTSYRLLPPNPIRELSLPVSYYISLNSDGKVTGVDVFGGIRDE